VKIYSYVVLNRALGGVNPTAVEAALFMGTDIVSMPTIDSIHHRETTPGIDPRERIRPVPVTENGELIGAVAEVCRLVAKADAILATGHVSSDESAQLLEIAHKEGVRRFIVTHASSPRMSMPIDLQRQLAEKYSALIEHSYVATLEGHMGMPMLPMSAIAEQISAVGATSCLMTTDLGQPENEIFADGLARFAEARVGLGISEEDVRIMVRDNAARVIERTAAT
jgi:hypothetical protein